ncbi:MAG: hypothetical protein ABIQ44_02635, partial [Chloroflexia bacterium]
YGQSLIGSCLCSIIGSFSQPMVCLLITHPDSDISSNTSKLRVSWLWLIAIALFFAFVFVLLLQSAMHKQLNHDEHMYVSSGVLILHNRWPYDDYPYFQMPLLSLIYAVAFSFWPDYLLVARLINICCAFGVCVLLFSFIARLLASQTRALRFGLAALSVTLYIAGSQFVYTSGIAWNHDLPVLLTIGALFILLSQEASPQLTTRIVVMILFSGVFIGLATSARLLFIVVALPFALHLFLAPPAPSFAMRLRRVAVFCVGVSLGLLPCLPFLIAAPSAFMFGNITYHGLNEQYWRTLNYERAMTLPAKLSYSFDIFLAEPANWLLILGVLVVLVLVLRFRQRMIVLPFVLSLSVFLALFVGALIPTPTWLQYFYAPYALLAVALCIGVALLVRIGQHRRIIVPFFTLFTLVSAAFTLPSYISPGDVFRFDDWTPTAISNVSREISAQVPTGTVVTLSPIYALQAGLNIYPALSSGPFGFRVANTLQPSTRQGDNLLSADDTVAQMTANPPEAILTGAEGTLEYALTQFATDHNYTQTTLSNGLTLWLRPK